MRTETPQTILLKDYRTPPYLAKKVYLTFDLGNEETLVTAKVRYVRSPQTPKGDPLNLMGGELKLVAAHIDGKKLDLTQLDVSPDHLTLNDLPDDFSLELVTRLRPQDNKALEGLYMSSGKYCTQCEAEGFRRMTYFLDRPDVMAEYETTIIADKKSFPVLLSNGNLIASGDKDQTRHFATWHDPFPKPSYLFALVAGDLAYLEDSFTTRSGRKVALRIYVEPWNISKTKHAMESVKAAMKWDEDVYGREYDLDIFMIVAVSDFNMGAMENKGLNIFNSKYVLADPNSATDGDFEGILSVVGHEYFHNWTGNRVTCRDWFQLCLKEGLTVFRDQEFSSDMTSREIVRIHNVAQLRNRQFPEDASPLAHPVRPEAYIEINNFYTTTVYEKGAEVVRMLHTILTPEGFRKGTDLYFERHDGQAVTIEDFLKAMADANGADLQQFKLWYQQSGTPEVEVTEEFSPEKKTYQLKLRQTLPPTPGQKDKKPQVIPVRAGLISPDGKMCGATLKETGKTAQEHILLLKDWEQTFTFNNVTEKPVPSLLRGFSAPVRLKTTLTDNDMQFIMSHDTDGFNRYEAAQKLAIKTIQTLSREGLKEGSCEIFANALGQLIKDDRATARLKAQTMTLPSLDYLVSLERSAAPVATLFDAIRYLTRFCAQRYQKQFKELYLSLMDKEYKLTPEAMGRRALKNVCLSYLMELQTPEVLQLAGDQYHRAHNMTDTIAALALVTNVQTELREELLEDFHKKWRNDSLVLTKWFAVQAGSRHPLVLHHVRALAQHPDFDPMVPNNVYSLYGTFGRGNPLGFHHESGEGYRFLADFIARLDAKNPQVASRVTEPLSRFRQYDAKRADLMRKELERLKRTPEISRDLFEIVSKSLQD